MPKNKVLLGFGIYTALVAVLAHMYVMGAIARRERFIRAEAAMDERIHILSECSCIATND